MNAVDWTIGRKECRMAKKPMRLDSDDEMHGPMATNTEPVEGVDRAPPSPTIHRQGDQVRPYCRRHNVLMRSVGTGGGVTRYKCPVPDCNEAEKRAQPRSVIPREPLECPKCRQRRIEADQPVNPVYCEVDASRSTSGQLCMACPEMGCDFHTLIPRPDIAVRARRMRMAAEEI